MEIIEQLKKYGLSQKQSVIYLALIKRIEASAYGLSKDTSIPRATIYEILDDMKAQGIVSSSRINGVVKYVAESPNRLSRLLKEKEEALNSILPSLLSYGNTEMNPNVRIYLGKDGAARVLDDIIDTLKHSDNRIMYTIAGTSLRRDKKDFLVKWVKERQRNFIKIKLIDYIDLHVDYGQDSTRETKLIDSKYSQSSDIDIYGNKVAIFSEVNGKEHSIIIESPSISEAFKKFHQFMWDHTEGKNLPN